MDSSSSLRPRRRLADDDDDLEEGQFVPTAYQQSSDTDDDDAHPTHVGHYRRRLSLEELLALGRGDALPSPTPSCESDGTNSDDRGGNPSPASVFRAEPKRVAVPLDGGWAATGRRGWTGGKLQLFSEATAPPLDAQSSHSNVSGEYSSSIHAAAFHQHQPAPPLPYADQATQLVHHQPPAAQQQQQQPPRTVVVPRGAADRPQREYTCKFCGKAYTSHQALGGHVAKHKSSQREAKAAAAAAGMMMPIQDGGAFLAALRRARRAEAPPHHQCRKCHKVFATGVALGGHMRVHYTGPPIVPARKKNRKRGLAPLAVEDVAVAAPPPTGLSLALPIKTEEAPSAAPAGAARVVRLFGIDISQKVQAPSEQQCSGTTEEFSAAGGQP
ncbi:hypothetical protein GQ55_3G020000 [Panicum hallii var. hallii]|uniref:C2H2-type domain-containing protein n=1 Tax=Panicum hallii var. hallii TaxID=1504633 RepID=A0A2T7E4V5_9POAL|nr:hypothetical protein GQ55_3G020000 [Panicum hallii var. hallii]